MGDYSILPHAISKQTKMFTVRAPKALILFKRITSDRISFPFIRNMNSFPLPQTNKTDGCPKSVLRLYKSENSIAIPEELCGHDTPVWDIVSDGPYLRVE